MTSPGLSWVCCQIGAREHYAIPRALARSGRLLELVTDTWADPASLIGSIGLRRMRERFHPELASARVWAANLSSLRFELSVRLRDTRGWERMILRNEWFQDRAVERLAQLARRHPADRVALFAYSYAAKRLFEFAKTRGWMTILGQIDPGPFEERLVTQLHARHPGLADAWHEAPERYWRDWRDECRLADRILVNSEWSRQALVSEGVSNGIIRTVPLAYEGPVADSRNRDYPGAFTDARPLRVLFLGQVNLRKGMAEVVDAAEMLAHDPVRFTIVGPIQMQAPDPARAALKCEWLGAVPRGDADRFYREADVFLFPTHSDGFGLTQLEAQAHRLPVVASRHCGAVVRDGINGILLDEVSGAAIAAAIRGLLANPGKLAAMSGNSRVAPEFDLAHLAAQLTQQVAA